MAGFTELMVKRGMTLVNTTSSDPRKKALTQANSMLKKLLSYKDPKQMDSATSNQNWWGISSRHGKRRVSVRYDSKIVPDLITEVADDISSVLKALEDFKAIIEEVDDATWAAEEKRRVEEKKKRTER